MNEFSINTFDSLKLSMASAEISSPKAVVQIVHGLKEHKRRYYNFRCIFGIKNIKRKK